MIAFVAEFKNTHYSYTIPQLLLNQNALLCSKYNLNRLPIADCLGTLVQVH